MSAETLAKDLGGRKVGGGWMARCPAHDDREPSLSIRSAPDDGKVLLHCHAGCDQARVIDALRARGLWQDNGQLHARVSPAQSHRGADDQPDHDDAHRKEAALRIWNEAVPSSGTLVEIYLQSRGIHIPLSPNLRFHAELKHPSGTIWPAMVALVTRLDLEPLAVHRTFLSRDGMGKATVEPQKMVLGPCRGGAVRLTRLWESLMVGEGIETCLAAMQATGRRAWAALSTSGLRTVALPPLVREVIVLADGDDAGELAARDAALRWQREGRRVRIARPPLGLDFNDLLLSPASSVKECTP